MGHFEEEVPRFHEALIGLGSALDGAGFVASGPKRNEVACQDFEQPAIETAGVALGAGQAHGLMKAAGRSL